MTITLVRPVCDPLPGGRKPGQGPTPVADPAWCAHHNVDVDESIYHRSEDLPVTVTDVDHGPQQLLVGVDRFDPEPGQAGEATVFLGSAGRAEGFGMLPAEALALVEVILDRVAIATGQPEGVRYVPSTDIRLDDQIWTSTEYGTNDGDDSREGWHTVCMVVAQPDGVEVFAHLDADSCDWEDGLTYRYGELVPVRRGVPAGTGLGCSSRREVAA